MQAAGNGSDIESYDVEIQGGSGNFAGSDTCAGDDPQVTTCSVAYTELRGLDFQLTLGETIVVRVRAVNEIGPGSYSALNDSGDILRTEPLSSPDPLSEGPATNDSQIEVTWTPLVDPYTGYDTITKYQIFWDNGSDGTDWAPIATQELGSITYSYTKADGISSGDPYKFKFRAFNQHGQGLDSPVATIYASARPEAPPSATTSVTGTDLVIAW